MASKRKKMNAQETAVWAAKVTELDLITLWCAVYEYVSVTYLESLRRCADAGLVEFPNNGTGLRLTDAGRTALIPIIKRNK